MDYQINCISYAYTFSYKFMKHEFSKINETCMTGGKKMNFRLAKFQTAM